MRAKTIKPNIYSTFQNFYEDAPEEIKDYIDHCAETPQTLFWHPEGDVKIHTNIVFNRAKRTGNINFMLAAIFHDLGKSDVTKKHPTNPNAWSTKMHEKISANLVKKYRDWIEELGGDYDIIHYIVDQHMRAKQIKVMRPFKQEQFRNEKYFDFVQRFTEFDDMRKNFSNDIDS